MKKWQSALLHELREFVFNFLFLSFFLIAFAWYRRLILASYQIEYIEYGVPLIEAAILAKIIMVGEVLGVGRHFRTWPLMIVTTYRTLVFSILVIVFMLAERVVGALIHGKAVHDGVAEITSMGANQLIAWYILVIAVFLPFFAFKEIEQAFGPEKVRELFFKWRSGDAR